ncbi:ABC transporter ATP-binding protein [Glutamicibacter protophormiae]|uniref:Bicarbonate transport ATP-binding protein CmpD n=1 Tax=Kocuria varians TaxID=1272 RepID=A0A7D7PT31_KOCVA|nr:MULTISPECIES: ABC transporter ATP-binding protein [Kocuria]WNB89401.1 ABC transporter ATP-binding protein [Glutamicibacter protophormiae]MDN5631904.1 ABC transporter ATP-binding protein [Kocuria sp.]QMS57474.1 Bicarbonate transport ATP-binding protein CmpD [Kocuria varians]RUP84558.1 ABC transporter ATP-binding protein [Kocuria sp. HSID17590]RUQ09398.1 ABC transporter ATP-binding protein [Kocuria sp. HSID17582]
MLSITDVRKTFFAGTVNERVALNGVSLTVNEGDFVTVIGSNGAGKSTLLNTVSGTIIPDSGEIRVGDRTVTRLPEHRKAKWISRVFQDPMKGSSPTLTIEQNMAIAQRRGLSRGLSRGVTRARRQEFTEELKTLQLGLENRLGAKVGLLSGGQRQALSLLMATFSAPEILLLDEHTAALDPQRAQHVTEITERIVNERHLTTLMVTHNMEQALRLGNRLIMLHEGRILFELDAEQKRGATVADLLAEFRKLQAATGEPALDDATLLETARSAGPNAAAEAVAPGGAPTGGSSAAEVAPENR